MKGSLVMAQKSYPNNYGTFIGKDKGATLLFYIKSWSHEQITCPVDALVVEYYIFGNRKCNSAPVITCTLSTSKIK